MLPRIIRNLLEQACTPQSRSYALDTVGVNEPLDCQYIFLLTACLSCSVVMRNPACQRKSIEGG